MNVHALRSGEVGYSVAAAACGEVRRPDTRRLTVRPRGEWHRYSGNHSRLVFSFYDDSSNQKVIHSWIIHLWMARTMFIRVSQKKNSVSRGI